MSPVFFLVLALAVGPVHAQMYKCVDKGKTVYSDKPCADGKGGEVDIKGQAPLSGSLRPPGTGNIEQQEIDFQRRQNERNARVEADAKAEEKRQRTCAALRSQLKIITEGASISRVNEKGERIYMDDAQRAEREKLLKNEMTRQRC